MFGKSLMDLFREKREGEFSDASNPVYSSEMADDRPEPEAGFKLELKRRRKANMIRQMLDEQGYGDLAKMIRVKEF